MKKLLATSGVISGTLIFASQAFAQVPVYIGRPNQGINPFTDVGTLLSNILTIVFILAALAVLFMLIIGAFNWITSGGEKDAIAKARQRIIAALVGLAVLALAFFIVRVVGGIVGVDVLSGFVLPRLDSPRQITQDEKDALAKDCASKQMVLDDKTLVCIKR
jgi:hypothetical protein